MLMPTSASSHSYAALAAFSRAYPAALAVHQVDLVEAFLVHEKRRVRAEYPAYAALITLGAISLRSHRSPVTRVLLRRAPGLVDRGGHRVLFPCRFV